MKGWSRMRRFQIIHLVLFAAMLTLLIAVSCWTAKATANDVWLEDLGVEILDTPHGPESNQTYYVHCDGEYVVGIEITYADGAVELRSGEYCGCKLYVVGFVTLAEVVWVTGYPSSIHVVRLPMVMVMSN